MSLISVIAEPSLAMPWAKELEADGHVIQCHWGPTSAETLFAGESPEIVIVDIEHPEWPESLLIPQSRATWPACKVIAVVSSYAFRTSAVYEMGLWKPDQLLLKPLAPRLLSATVTFLWAQLRTEEIKRMVNAHPFTLEPPKQQFAHPAEADVLEWQPQESKRQA